MNVYDPSIPGKVTDVRGKEVFLPAFPSTIVSLVPSITETLFAFGLEERVAGITPFCIKPEDKVGAVEKIGGPKDPDIDKIVSLKTDLVLANREENSREVVEAIERRGIPVFVTYPRTVVESLKMLEDITSLTGCTPEAQNVISNAEKVINSFVKTSVFRFACLIWKNPYMTVSSDTYINDIITFCGGINLYGESEKRYPAITIEELRNASPDIIFLPSEPYDFSEKDAAELRVLLDPEMTGTPRIITATGEMFSWYGSRMVDAIPYIARLIMGEDG